MELTEFGIWVSPRTLGDAGLDEAAVAAERVGFGAVWLGGSPQPSAVGPILSATDQLVAATGIVNVWASDPDDVAAQRAALIAEFPDRFVMGIGIGHREATTEYRRPLAVMEEFLDGLDEADQPVPAGERCLAALGPRMLDLCRDRSGGTHTYFVPVKHTQFARDRLGDGPLIAVELACVVEPDPEHGRDLARRYASLYLKLSNYTNNLLRHGFTEADLADGGSDRLIDAVVPHGEADDIAEVARAHLDAGADHVCLQTVGVSGVPDQQWAALADALGL